MEITRAVIAILEDECGLRCREATEYFRKRVAIAERLNERPRVEDLVQEAVDVLGSGVPADVWLGALEALPLHPPLR